MAIHLRSRRKRPLRKITEAQHVFRGSGRVIGRLGLVRTSGIHLWLFQHCVLLPMHARPRRDAPSRRMRIAMGLLRWSASGTACSRCCRSSPASQSSRTALRRSMPAGRLGPARGIRICTAPSKHAVLFSARPSGRMSRHGRVVAEAVARLFLSDCRRCSGVSSPPIPFFPGFSLPPTPTFLLRPQLGQSSPHVGHPGGRNDAISGSAYGHSRFLRDATGTTVPTSFDVSPSFIESGPSSVGAWNDLAQVRLTWATSTRAARLRQVQ